MPRAGAAPISTPHPPDFAEWPVGPGVCARGVGHDGAMRRAQTPWLGRALPGLAGCALCPPAGGEIKRDRSRLDATRRRHCACLPLLTRGLLQSGRMVVHLLGDGHVVARASARAWLVSANHAPQVEDQGRSPHGGSYRLTHPGGGTIPSYRRRGSPIS